jgi:hypothetical protein
MGRPPSLTRAINRRIEAARKAGRLGPEHEAQIALAQHLARVLVDDDTPASAQAGTARELATHLRALGLAPEASAPGELGAMLAELRGE